MLSTQLGPGNTRPLSSLGRALPLYTTRVDSTGTYPLRSDREKGKDRRGEKRETQRKREKECRDGQKNGSAIWMGMGMGMGVGVRWGGWSLDTETE